MIKRKAEGLQYDPTSLPLIGIIIYKISRGASI